MKKNIKKLLLTGVVATSLLTTGCNLFNQEEAKWHTGDTAPTSETGNDGDYYFDLTTNKTYYKEDGEWKEKVTSNNKNITKIEKLSETEDKVTYKVTYSDGTTENVDVEKDSESLEATQEEMFEDFITASSNSMAKPYYYIAVDVKEDNGEIIEKYQQITTDANGYYHVEQGLKKYTVKIGNEYIRYYDYDNELRAYSTAQNEWEEEKQSFLQQANSLTPEDAKFPISNIFTSSSIDNLKEIVATNLIEGFDAQTVSTPTVEFSKQYDSTLNKYKLVLEIDVNYVTSTDSNNNFNIVLEMCDNQINKLIIEKSESTETITLYMTFEYSTKTTLVPSSEELARFPEPTE